MKALGRRQNLGRTMTRRKAFGRRNKLLLLIPIVACVVFVVGNIIAPYFYSVYYSDNDLSTPPPTNSDATCLQITSALDVAAWPGVMYHKDLNPTSSYDSRIFSSVEEDDGHARLAIYEFNKIRSSVLTPHLLDAGIQSGGGYPARTFARHLMVEEEESVSVKNSTSSSLPLLIAVFGNSFTIGSNCGESSSQEEEECAWPGRLARRWEEIGSTFFHNNNNAKVEWRFFQENAQSSLNIAQKLPAIIDEFHAKNVTPDAILLDNTITDAQFREDQPWFEVVVRALVQSFPGRSSFHLWMPSLA